MAQTTDRESRSGFFSPEISLRRVLAAFLYLVTPVVLAVGFLPIALWFASLGLATATSRYLGQWPRYNHPDPFYLPADLPLRWLEWSVPLVVVLCSVAAIEAVLHFRLRKQWWALALPAIAGLSWGAGLAILALDPWGIVDWYFD